MSNKSPTSFVVFYSNFKIGMAHEQTERPHSQVCGENKNQKRRSGFGFDIVENIFYLLDATQFCIGNRGKKKKIENLFAR